MGMTVTIDREQFEVERMVEMYQEVKQGFPLSPTIFSVCLWVIL
jgi:hypothetical protein